MLGTLTLRSLQQLELSARLRLGAVLHGIKLLLQLVLPLLDRRHDAPDLARLQRQRLRASPGLVSASAPLRGRQHMGLPLQSCQTSPFESWRTILSDTL